MNYVLEQSDPNVYGNVKIEYHDPTDTRRMISQTFSYKENSGEEPLLKARKILNYVENSGNNLPRIAIKREINGAKKGQVIVLSNGWDNKGVNKKIKFPEIISNSQTGKISALRQTMTSNGGNGEVSTVSPRGSDSGIESDCADFNLSWLLNYKIREFPPFLDAQTADDATKIVDTISHQAQEIYMDEELQKPLPKPRDNLPKKPPFTYTELIEHALTEQGQLTVSGIYAWISNHFPFYKTNDDRWKNSVRHNLSINPHFRKGGKASQGAGHFWTIASRDENKSYQMRQKIQEFLRLSSAQNNEVINDAAEDAREMELLAATNSILEQMPTELDLPLAMPSELNNTENNTEPTTLDTDEIPAEFIAFSDDVIELEGFLPVSVSKQDLVNGCLGLNDDYDPDINPNLLGMLDEVMTLEYYQLK